MTELFDRWLNQKWTAVLILLMVGGAVLFAGLGNRQFVSEDEGRFAEIGREIAVSREPAHWIIQTVNGETYDRKPPLFPALIALSFKLFGRADEFTASFPSALFAVLTLVVCFLFWRRRFGGPLAFVSCLMLALTYKFVDQGRSVQVDMVMLFFVTAALLSAWIYLDEEPPRAIFGVLFFLGSALATLTKGPVGLALPCLVVGIYVIWKKKWGRLFSWPVVAGLAVYFILVGGWIGAAYRLAGKEYVYHLLFRESFVRYVDAFDHQAGPFYYFPEFATGFFPWIVFFVLVLFSPSWRKNEKGKPLGFFWVWFLAVFIFFSLSGSKRGLYLLPLYPAACLIVGNGWKNQGKKWISPLFAIALIFCLVYPLFEIQFCHYKEKRAGRPKEKVLEVGRLVDGAPIRAYRMMNPGFLFYLERTIPVFENPDEAENFLASKEKVFLIANDKKDSSFIEKLKTRWPVAYEIVSKNNHFYLFSNKN